MEDEHFGIAVAEFVRGGCIPFVPASGGQAEIIGDEPRILFRTPQQAIERIVQLLGSASDQEAVLDHLRPRKQFFSGERFVNEIRGTVRRFLESATEPRS